MDNEIEKNSTIHTSSNKSKQVFLFLLFVFFLYPISIYMDGNGVSANYAYVFFPLILVAVSGVVKTPCYDVSFMLMLYLIIFLVALFYQHEVYHFSARRVISFILFMCMFLYVFVNVDSNMIIAFKGALVAVSILFSIRIIIDYFLLGGNDLGNAGKGLVGSQRYGFVYIMAFWVVMHYRPHHKSMMFLKLIGVFLIAAAILLTFSRSSIVSLLGSIVVYFYYYMNAKNGQAVMSKSRSIVSLLGILFVIFLLNRLFPSIFEFYDQRLFSWVNDDGSYVYDFSSHNASEGYRVNMFYKIMEFVGINPFTGSGFLGVWIMFDSLSGSAHSQYFDVIFRTGIFGFLIYVYMLFKLFIYLRNNHRDLFYGFIGVLIYGLVHETFKISQGAFILSFLLGMMATSSRYMAKYSRYFNKDSQVDSVKC